VEQLRLVFGSRRSGWPDAGDPSFQHAQDFFAQLLGAVLGPIRQLLGYATEGSVIVEMPLEELFKLMDFVIDEWPIHVLSRSCAQG
jgi:hypothetical protein